MKRCAVIIGVDKVGDLPILKSGILGAKKFADWANGQDIDVTLLVDADSHAVLVNDVFSSIDSYVASNSYDQLIIYFSGHGILKAPDCELWLLSNAMGNPNEAVNLFGSVYLARNSLIKHIIIVSDACRTYPDTHQLNAIYGGLIFPSGQVTSCRSDVDLFYATLPGDPAYEAKFNSSSIGYHGVFTRCLLDGVKGKEKSIISYCGYIRDGKDVLVVTSWSLKDYLVKIVPEAAAKIHLRLQQFPEIRVESHPPNFFSEIGIDESVVDDGLQCDRMLCFCRPLDFCEYDGHDKIARPFNCFNSSLLFVLRFYNNFKEIIANQFLFILRRITVPFDTGIVINGCNLVEVVTSNAELKIMKDWMLGSIILRASKVTYPETVLLRIDNILVPLVVFPGRVGVVNVSERRIDSINYKLGRSLVTNSRFCRDELEVEIFKNDILFSAWQGEISLDLSVVKDLIDVLQKKYSYNDPVLSFYLSWYYLQIGDFDSIGRIYEELRGKDEFILFDIAMLAKKINANNTINNALLASGFCPIFTKGWALLEPCGVNVSSSLHDCKQYLLPGLWTSFSLDAIGSILKYLREGLRENIITARALSRA